MADPETMRRELAEALDYAPETDWADLLEIARWQTGQTAKLAGEASRAEIEARADCVRSRAHDAKTIRALRTERRALMERIAALEAQLSPNV